MTDIFSGDPKLHLNGNGSYLAYRGGQPVMETGEANVALIALFTRRGWCGNILARSDAERIGSDFEAACDEPITLSSLNTVRDAAEKALLVAGYREVTAQVSNPRDNTIAVKIVAVSQRGTRFSFVIVKGFKSTSRKSLLTFDGDPITYDGEYIFYVP